jgi:hypothetical protein
VTARARQLSGKLLTAMAGSLFAATLAAQDYASMTREQKAVVVNGVRESWRLQWETIPQSTCGVEDLEVALACPCAGFAYGEAGRLALVRMRAGHPQERLELAPFFKDQGAPGSPGLAVLQHRRPIPAAAHDEDDDWHHAADFDFRKRVDARGPTELMKFGDYNHDGRASEFLLQVGVRPCGLPRMILVGVSRFTPQLHVFASAELPEQPLVLPATVWAALLKGTRPVHAVESGCDDPDSGGTETTVDVWAQRGVLHARRESAPCPGHDAAGPASNGGRY